MTVRLLAIAFACLLVTACSQPDSPSASTKLAQHGLLSAALTTDGKYLFTGSFQHGGALWDQNAQARLYDWNHTTDGYSAYLVADFSEDGHYLATTDGSSVLIWDTLSGEAGLYLESPAQSLSIQNTRDIWQTNNGESSEYWRKPARILSLALSKQYLLLGLENQVALLVNISDQSVIGALAHDDVLTGVAMDDSAKYAVTGTRNGTMTLWSLEDGSKVSQVTYSSPIAFVQISPDGRQVISAALKGPVALHNTEDGEEKILFKGNPGIISTAFGQQGIILGSSREKVWEIDILSGQIVKTWQVPKRGPWHKAAILAVTQQSNHRQAIASDGFAYQLN